MPGGDPRRQLIDPGSPRTPGIPGRLGRLVVLSGLVEPLLYLFSIGVGVGTLVGTLPLPDGRLVPYAAFVAPSMLASSAMFGALSESTFNFFGKMKYMRPYDGVLATPVRPMEIAFGELLWAMARGAIYSASFSPARSRRSAHTRPACGW